jgi:transcriptional regulator with XRE-family HTH domain
MEPNFVEQIRNELIARKGRWPDVCKATGVGYSWLTKFAQGKIPNPGISRLQVLHRHFHQ